MRDVIGCSAEAAIEEVHIRYSLAVFYKQVLSLAKGTSNAAAVFQTIGVRLMLLGLNFGTGIVVARSLGPFGRGELAALGLWPTFLAALSTLGIPTALAYHSRRQPEHRRENFAVAVILMLVMGGCACVAGTVLLPILLRGYDPKIVRAAQTFMIFAPTILLGQVVSAHLEAIGDFRRSILAQLNPTIVTLVALITLRVSGHLSPIVASLSYAVPSALQALLLATRVWPRGTRAPAITQRARPLLAYGLRSYGTDIIGTFASQLDLAVILMFLSASELGLYSIALSLSRLLNIVQASLISVLFPRASSLAPEESVALISRAARVSTVISAALGVGFLLTAPIVLPRLYGAQFGGAVALLPLLTAEAIIGGIGGVLKQSFLATGRPFVVTLIEGGSIISAVCLLSILVPRMNVLGAATALLCTSVIRMAAIMIAYRFILKRPLPRLLPTAADVLYLRLKIAGSVGTRSGRLAEEI